SAMMRCTASVTRSPRPVAADHCVRGCQARTRSTDVRTTGKRDVHSAQTTSSAAVRGLRPMPDILRSFSSTRDCHAQIRVEVCILYFPPHLHSTHVGIPLFRHMLLRRT